MTPEPLGTSKPLVPPLYQSSVYTLPDLDALDAIMEGGEPGFIYARDSHPNARHLASRLAHLEGAEWSLVTSSGMSALSAILLVSVQQGSTLVASHRLYGRTTQLLAQELPRFGVKTVFVDIADLEQVNGALSNSPSLLLVETLSNPHLRLANLPVLAEMCQRHRVRFVVDNTFATPVLCKPLDLGADVVMESLTKMIGGHADVTLGLLAGRGDLLPELTQAASIWGLSSNPFDCWLTERGLDTLGLRMTTASRNAALLADWLAEQPGVARVLYPTRPDHPDRELALKLMGCGGNMLCFDLEGGREAVNRFMRTSIPFSPSLGNTTTTCSHPATTSHRYTSPAEKLRQGITAGLIRLSVGIEDVEQIKAVMRQGLMPAKSA